MEPKMLTIGSICEIAPGYNSETGECDIWDEVAGCECQVVKFCSSYEVEVFIKVIGECWINRSRLKVR